MMSPRILTPGVPPVPMPSAMRFLRVAAMLCGGMALLGALLA